MTTLFHSIESKHHEVSIFKQKCFVRHMIDFIYFYFTILCIDFSCNFSAIFSCLILEKSYFFCVEVIYIVHVFREIGKHHGHSESHCSHSCYHCPNRSRLQDLQPRGFYRGIRRLQNHVKHTMIKI